MDYDIVLVGDGPAGLSFARAMAGSGLSIAIVEQQEGVRWPIQPTTAARLP